MGKYIRLMNYVYRFFCYIVPAFAVFYIILRFSRDYFLESTSTTIEQYKILIGAIGLTATITGLSYRAARITENKERKNNYIYVSENLFLATLFFIYALLIEYCSGFININFFTWILNISQAFLFLHAAHRIFISIIRLQSTLPRIDR